MTPKIKQIIIAVIIIVIAFVGFKMFFTEPNLSDTTLVSENTNPPTFVDGQTILVLLNNLSKVTLDESVFSHRVFTSLVSFTRPLQEQVVGRPNPFQPIGIDNSSSPLSTEASTTRSNLNSR